MAVGLVALALVLFGYAGIWFYRSQAREVQSAAEGQLEAIGRMKVSEIERWRLERLGDGELLARSPLFVEGVAGWLQGGGSESPVRVHLQALSESYSYSHVCVVDSEGRVRLGAETPLEPLEREGIGVALLDGHAHLTDIFSHGDPRTLSLSLVSPVRRGDMPIGAVVLRIEAATFLYRLIESWPTQSETAETLLVRKEGEEVLFLNELRHRKGTALSLRIPLTRREVPAVQAVRGVGGVIRGTDYRGVDVFSYIHNVSGCSWIVVAKIDSEEALAGWRARSTSLLIALFAIFGTASAVLVVAWHARERRQLLVLLDDRKRTQEAIRELNEALEKRVAERTAELTAANKELEAFTYSVSHDLRAPLRAIDGFARILEEDLGPALGEAGNRSLGIVRGEARRMGQLIDDLLQFSRIGRASTAFREVDMTALVREVVVELRRQYCRPEVEFHCGDLPPAQGDAKLLRQVWMNLLANAWKFSGRQQSPRIDVEGAREPDGRITYVVRDNGVGFDMRYADKLFGVFQRLHPRDAFDGTGVGLAIVQRIVHRHQGTVGAEAKVDGGAMFSFTLPGERR